MPKGIYKHKSGYKRLNQKRENRNPVKDKDIIEEYLTGKTLVEVAKKLNISPSLVGLRLKKNNIEIKTRPRRTRHQRKPIPIEQLIKDYKAGMLQRQLAEKYNVSQDTIWQRLKNNGIKTSRRPGISEDTRTKLKDSHTGKPSFWKGKERPFETRKKISEASSGDKNHNWKGGTGKASKIIRRSFEYRIWRKAVYSRDYFTCFICKHHGGVLAAHHINNFSEFPEQRFLLDNGITMCEPCHNKFHKTYGNQNNTAEQLEQLWNDAQL